MTSTSASELLTDRRSFMFIYSQRLQTPDKNQEPKSNQINLDLDLDRNII